MFHRHANSLEEGKQRDLAKKSLCKDKGIKNILFSCLFEGITLIEVPYWWDRKHSSLAASIYSQRPDLFTEPIQGPPIPSTAPTSTEQSTKSSNSHFFPYSKL
jgi:hypothetical protein